MLINDILSKARTQWMNGKTLDAGKLLFEQLDMEIRPRWAANILKLVLERTGIKSNPIDRIISIANCPNDWGKAHDAFSALRKAALDLEQLKARSPQQTLLLSHLLLAELVAKVTYNSTNPPDGFDEDSGWWIAPCLKDILNLVGDQKFSAAMWSALSSDEMKNGILPKGE
jgi:hypothetical protein